MAPAAPKETCPFLSPSLPPLSNPPLLLTQVRAVLLVVERLAREPVDGVGDLSVMHGTVSVVIDVIVLSCWRFSGAKRGQLGRFAKARRCPPQGGAWALRNEGQQAAAQQQSMQSIKHRP